MNIEDLKANNTKQQLAEAYIKQSVLIDDIGNQKLDLSRKLAQKEQVIDDMAGLQEQMAGELESAERKLKVVEEATRAGLAMLYPDAPIPSRHTDQFGYEHGSAILRSQNLEEPKPEERLLVYILQEAI